MTHPAERESGRGHGRSVEHESSLLMQSGPVTPISPAGLKALEEVGRPTDPRGPEAVGGASAAGSASTPMPIAEDPSPPRPGRCRRTARRDPEDLLTSGPVTPISPAGLKALEEVDRPTDPIRDRDSVAPDGPPASTSTSSRGRGAILGEWLAALRLNGLAPLSLKRVAPLGLKRVAPLGLKGQVIVLTALVSSTLLLVFGLWLISLSATCVQIAATIHPRLGQLALLILLALDTGLVLAAVVIFVRFPRAVIPPGSADPAEIDRYLRSLGDRLWRNHQLEFPPDPSTDPEQLRLGIEATLRQLDQVADEVIRATATRVFVSTALCRYGRLDGLFVVLTHLRMIWQVAGIYSQRGTVRELMRLYGNVAGTAWLEGGMPDLELGDEIVPFTTTFAIALDERIPVPGIRTVLPILTRSLLDGTANAFLTLRVGILARRTCGAMDRDPGRVCRRAATAEAAGLLGEVVSLGLEPFRSTLLRGLRPQASRSRTSPEAPD